MVNKKPEERMRLVFAGTHEEFRRCCHDQGWIPGHHATYVNDEMQLRGLDPKKVLIVRYGQHHRNKAVYSDYLKMLEAKGAETLWV
jgi:hypothetical protein